MFEQIYIPAARLFILPTIICRVRYTSPPIRMTRYWWKISRANKIAVNDYGCIDWTVLWYNLVCNPWSNSKAIDCIHQVVKKIVHILICLPMQFMQVVSITCSITDWPICNWKGSLFTYTWTETILMFQLEYVTASIEFCSMVKPQQPNNQPQIVLLINTMHNNVTEEIYIGQ